MSAEVIATKNGKIKGKVVKVTGGKPVSVYRNVPFGKPPVGNLRFMPPQPAEPWEGVKDGTQVGSMPMCMSVYEELLEKFFPFSRPEGANVKDEDCLHLTIYSPNTEKGKKLPVMVWLYGGGFGLGSESEYDGTVLASLNDVVVVIPNYRVGIFGFFTLGLNSGCTGNAGIMDQQLALRWVQDNIEAFGGDKGNVTIFGESAGGISVHLNIVSPLSRGLFHKAISHSGQVSMPVLFNGKEENEKAMSLVLKHFKIEEKEDSKILAALQRIPAKELVKVQPEFEKARIQFYPTMDGKVLKKLSKQYLVDNDFTKVPYIVGCNNTEASGVFGSPMGEEFEKGISEEKARTLIPFPLTDKGWEECKKFYGTNESSNADRYSKLMSNVFADSSFVAPAMHDAAVHAKSGATVYMYLGAFQLRMHHDADYGEGVAKKPSWCICDHGDDILITFGQAFGQQSSPLGAKYSEEEKILSRKWMSYITNFAKSGDPNVGVKVEKPWPKYQPGGDMLVLAHNISTEKNYKPKETKFWMETMAEHILSQ